jgi:hypothetical protein
MSKYRSAAALPAACGVAMALPAVGFAQDNGQPSPTPMSSIPPGPYPFIAVSPQKSTAGEDVLVSVGCPVGDLGEVKSVVLDRVGKFEVTSENPVIQGAVAHISDKATPGYYSVKAICEKTTVMANFEVTPPRTPTSTTKPPKATPTRPSSSAKPASGRQVSKVPVGAPQTGGGGTVR